MTPVWGRWMSFVSGLTPCQGLVRVRQGDGSGQSDLSPHGQPGSGRLPSVRAPGVPCQAVTHRAHRRFTVKSSIRRLACHMRATHNGHEQTTNGHSRTDEPAAADQRHRSSVQESAAHLPSWRSAARPPGLWPAFCLRPGGPGPATDRTSRRQHADKGHDNSGGPGRPQAVECHPILTMNAHRHQAKHAAQSHDPPRDLRGGGRVGL